MIIKRISGYNFKGRNFKTDLAPVTLLTGRNAAGKSAQLEALVLAILGYLPGVASKPSDLFGRLASGSPMSVIAENDDGHYKRVWTESKGSIKYSGNPLTPDANSVMLDPSEFFGLSGPEQTKFLFAKAKLPADLTIDALSASITANIKNIKLDENTEATEKAAVELAKFVRNECDEASTGNGQSPGETTTQEFVEAIVVKIGDKKKAAVANVQRMEKAFQASAQTQEDRLAAPVDAEATLQKAQAALSTAEQQLAVLKSDGQKASLELSTAEDLAGRAVDETLSRKRMAELSSEKEKLFKATAAGRPDASKAQSELEAAHTAETKASQVLVLAQAKYQERKERLEFIQAEKTCPTCGQDTVECRRSLVKGLKAELQEADALAQAAAKALKPLEAATRAHRQVRDVLVTQQEKYDAQQSSFRVASQMHADLQAALDKNAEAQKAKDSVPLLEAAVNKARSDYTLQKNGVEQLRTTAGLAETDYKALLRDRAEAASQAAVAEEAIRAKAEADILKEAVKLLAALQAELVDKAVGPLLADANRLCGGLLKSPLQYRNGEIVMEDEGKFWTWRTFSGMERAVTFAALSVALAKDAPFKLMVLDRLVELDEENLYSFIESMCTLVAAGRLDQVVLTDHRKVKESAACKNFACVEVAA